jgi:hypothetical protein
VDPVRLPSFFYIVRKGRACSHQPVAALGFWCRLPEWRDYSRRQPRKWRCVSQRIPIRGVFTAALLLAALAIVPTTVD